MNDHNVVALKLVLVAEGMCALAAMVGCGGGAPPPIRPPKVDPSKAAARAIEIYDQDGDGSLSGPELERVPAVLAALRQYDADSDRRVTREEMADRLASLYKSRVGLTQAAVVVRLDRRPLAGATVRFEPEPFLDGAVKPAEGVTDAGGRAVMAIPDELLPATDRGLSAMQVGVYKVRITHPTRTILAKYNTETTLGFELDPAMADDIPVFDLSSR